MLMLPIENVSDKFQSVSIESSLLLIKHLLLGILCIKLLWLLILRLRIELLLRWHHHRLLLRNTRVLVLRELMLLLIWITGRIRVRRGSIKVGEGSHVSRRKTSLRSGLLILLLIIIILRILLLLLIVLLRLFCLGRAFLVLVCLCRIILHLRAFLSFWR